MYVGKIYNISFSELRLAWPHDDKLHSIKRSRISQILYGDGRRDLFIALDDRTVKHKELVDTSRILWWSTKPGPGPHRTDQKGSLHNGVNFTFAGAGGAVTGRKLVKLPGAVSSTPSTEMSRPASLAK